MKQTTNIIYSICHLICHTERATQVNYVHTHTPVRYPAFGLLYFESTGSGRRTPTLLYANRPLTH